MLLRQLGVIKNSGYKTWMRQEIDRRIDVLVQDTVDAPVCHGKGFEL